MIAERMDSQLLSGPRPGKAPVPLERSEALGRLARRYLAGHAPADARDLAKWAKLTIDDARSAFDNIRDELTERPEGARFPRGQ